MSRLRRGMWVKADQEADEHSADDAFIGQTFDCGEMFGRQRCDCAKGGGWAQALGDDCRSPCQYPADGRAGARGAIVGIGLLLTVAVLVGGLWAMLKVAGVIP